MTGVIIGSGIAALAQQAGAYGIADVAVVDDQKFIRFSHAANAAAIASAAKQEDARHRPDARECDRKGHRPASVPVRLEAGYVPDCIALRVKNGEIVASRPVFAGKAQPMWRVYRQRSVFTSPERLYARTGGGCDGAARP